MWQNVFLFRVKWEKIALKIEPLSRKIFNLNFHKQTNKKFPMKPKYFFFF